MIISLEQMVIIDQSLERAIDDCEYQAKYEPDDETIKALKQEADHYQSIRLAILREARK